MRQLPKERAINPVGENSAFPVCLVWGLSTAKISFNFEPLLCWVQETSPSWTITVTTRERLPWVLLQGWLWERAPMGV